MFVVLKMQKARSKYPGLRKDGEKR